MTFRTTSIRVMRAFTLSAGVLAAGALVSATAALAATKTYDVTIKTTDIGGGGTDADVHITLYGTQSPRGVKSERDLDKSNYDDFETGDRDTYKVSFDEDIGELEQIKLEHDDSNSGSGWHVSYVHIYDPVNKETVKFSINRWLATDESDGRTHVVVRRDDYDAWQKRYAAKIPAPEGNWTRVCSGGQGCSATITKSLTLGGSEKDSWSNTVTASLSVAVEKKTTLPYIGKSKVTVTAGVENANTQAGEIVRTRSDNYTESCTENFDFTTYNIHSVWQWTITAQIEGEPVVVKTCDATCTATAHPPAYAPGDKRDIGACLASRDFKSILNAGLPGHNREILEQVSLSRCQQACTDRTWCKTVDYERFPGKCFLQDVGQSEVALRHDYPDNPYDHYYLPAKN